MSTLEALAQRCEAMTGPDRRLDAAIGAAVRALPIDGSGWPQLSGWQGEFAATKFEGRIAALDSKGEMSVHWEAREYTASIDDAMLLIPDGWEWLIRSPCKDGPNDRGRHFARLSSADFDSVTWGKGETWLTEKLAGEEALCWAATPALALCAAALRARERIETGTAETVFGLGPKDESRVSEGNLAHE